ncbi:cadherin-23 [Neocloeon triangulifer]|uniref:cadherin-23 n=1 Tax=Neocloeon triangulifer TaxID=2078957 RepID=UPI00286F8520|nr:cadherin-23 [Neocloeon triangulifer]
MKALWWRALLLTLLGSASALHNNRPPRFMIDGQTEIVLRLKEGTPAGSLIYRLRGFDPDGDTLTFGVREQAGQEILRIVRINDYEAHIYLRKELDRELKDEYALVLTLTDGRLGEGNFITQSLLIIVEDVNDNAPIFKPYQASISVREDSPPRVLAELEATDLDEGPYGQVVYSLGELDGEEGMFSVSTINGRGVVKLVGQLDYERKFLYQIKVLATDRSNNERVNTGTAALLIRVQDVEDQPPEFVSVPPVTRVSEDTRINSPVLKVKAIDGDRGVNNKITYAITRGGAGIFGIDSNTGIVYNLRPLDREDPKNSNGAYILEITAKEESRALSSAPTAKTEVTIMVMDVNDEAPRFRSAAYVCEVNEGAQANSPLTFLGNTKPEVFDHDQGNNGTFQLFLNGDKGVFEVTPREGINEASFLIRVKNPAMLDYEQVKSMNFTIVAKETVPNNPKYSSVPVTVFIRDVNDNFPEFTEPFYEVSVPENSKMGTTVAWVQAMDEDSGNFGTQGIRYTSVGGTSAEILHLDAITGVITIKSNDISFDRELISRHYLTVEARDDLGRGNRNTVQLTLNILDVNDNAPVFAQDKYEAKIVENSDDFNPPLFIEAYDEDLNGTANTEIYYSIVAGNALRNFTIDAVTGRVRPSSLIDFEKLPGSSQNGVRAMNLVIRAQDRGEPKSLFSEVSLIVYVQDANDHAPRFEKMHYTASIPEDLEGGSPVVQVHAYDLDGSSPNNLVAYRLMSGAGDKFIIDSDTGAISVAPGASLDPDKTDPKTDLYVLKVLAIDGGLGKEQKSAEVIVEVQIEDVNNKAPQFIDPGTIAVRENVPVGEIIYRIRAVDLDARPVLRYYIDPAKSEARNEEGIRVKQSDYNYTAVFEVSPSDGIIKVARGLDREKVDLIRLALRVEDLAATKEPQIATAYLTILVDDENDNNPKFRLPHYQRSITENSKIGVVIMHVTADDADKNRTIRYSIEGPHTDLISLDSETGEVHVGSKIDRELQSWINVTIRATDNGVPPRFSFAECYIQILDENDNNPFFVGDIVNITVREDAPLGTEIARLEARDADAGDFGKITYLLDRISSGGKFRINPDTGVLNISEVLNREERSFYTLIIEAWDNYQFGYQSGESRNAFKQIGVNIVDVNDEAPVFEIFDGCASITEFHPIGELITVVKAHDKDDPLTPNGRMVFSIVGGNEQGLFEIENLDFSSAKITAGRTLKALYGNYTLSVKAQDLGMPPNEATTEVRICVTDFNDNAPRFLSPPHNYTVIVPENATIGTPVIEVHAIDDDIGANGAVRYRIKQDPLGHWRTFDIDHVTGLIELKELLDRERQKIYEIRVEAYDLGIPTPLSSDLDLMIYVRDVNDFEPQFVKDKVLVNFTEHALPGEEHVKLPDTIDRDEIDLLDGPPPPVCYFIVGGDAAEKFHLDAYTHELTAVKELDREEQAKHELLVRATENCHETPAISQTGDSNNSNNSLLRVSVNVKDINDNAPKFVKHIFTGGFTTETDYGTEFMRVKAIDLDAPEHGNVSYYLSGNVKMTLSEGLEHVKRSPFMVDRETGGVILNFDPQRGMKGYFEFMVIANDTDGLQDKAIALVYLLREDQRVRFVLRQHPGEVREKIDKFRDVLGNVTGAIVNADDYKVHVNSDGTVDKTRTDLYLHLVDKRNNSIMDVAEALRRVDLNIEKLDALFKEFNVLDTQPAEAQALRAEPENMLLFYFFFATVFLSILLVLTLSLCLVQRTRYLRQIKAATVNAFVGATPTVRLSGRAGRVPNTNMHSTEGSNPIWMQAYENEWYKSDEEVEHGSTEQASEQDSLDDNAITSEETCGESHDDTNSTPPVSRSNNKQTIFFGTERRMSNIVVTQESSSEVKENNELNRGTFHQNLYTHFEKLSSPFGRKLETTEL